jgi:hypothetical protein
MVGLFHQSLSEFPEAVEPGASLLDTAPIAD